MTTVPSKPHQPLHNFSLPCLKWSHRNLANRNRSIKTKADEQNGAVSQSNSGRLSDADGEVRPWNLRPRRLVISTVNGVGAVATVEENEEDERLKKKRRLWISLSKEEIEEDVYALTGSRPARRPKKRNRIVQKQVDNVFPGLYLVGTSVDSYRV